MENWLAIACIAFFYISLGAQARYNTQYIPELGKMIATIVCLVDFVFPIIIYCNVFNIKWYWSILMNIFLGLPISVLLSFIYCSIFGIRTGIQFSYTKGEMCREHLYFYDMLITLVIAAILFVAC